VIYQITLFFVFKGLYGHPYDCTKFYYCQITHKAGQPKPIITRHEFVIFFFLLLNINYFIFFYIFCFKSCPNDLHFNVLICQCDWPASHCQNTMYTYCSEGKNSTSFREK
jgi:hypothetical protein